MDDGPPALSGARFEKAKGELALGVLNYN